MKSIIKETVFRIASGAGFTAAARSRHKHCARVLAYHGVDPDSQRSENFDGFQVPPAVFESHLQMLTRRFSVVPLREIAESLAAKKPLPANSVAITFDDGYANNLSVAAPLLAKYGCPATVFVTTGYMDGTHVPWWYSVRAATSDRDMVLALEAQLKDLPMGAREKRVEQQVPGRSGLPYPLLDWEQVKKLAAMGFDIGAHTVRHPSLGRETEAVAGAEVTDSFARIAEMTGTRPVLFAYPYGRRQDVVPSAVQALQRAGCVGAVTTQGGMIRDGDDALRMNRFNVTGNHTAAALEALVSGLHAV